MEQKEMKKIMSILIISFIVTWQSSWTIPIECRNKDFKNLYVGYLGDSTFTGDYHVACFDVVKSTHSESFSNLKEAQKFIDKNPYSSIISPMIGSKKAHNFKIYKIKEYEDE